MPVVKMPNGALVDMPDSPTPEQQAALRAMGAVQQSQIGLDKTNRELVKVCISLDVRLETIQSAQGSIWITSLLEVQYPQR